ncbi:MAG TPA: MlaD family protein [Ignavibacteria bacterium]|nr:MlaD family protein [Ignavibacteria bacterium]
MASNKFGEFKVGLFVVIATLIVLITIFWAKGFSGNLEMQEYSVFFPKVSGVNEGDMVSVNGVRKGKIDKIELVGDSVGIKFSIDKTIKIRSDYDIYVAATELTGGKVLYLEPGKSSETVNPNTPLHGNAGADFASLLNSLGDITKDVKSLLGDFKTSADNLNKVILNVNDIVGDGYLKANLKTTLSNLAVSSGNLNSLVADSRNGMNRITTKLENTVGNVDVAVGDNSRELKNTLMEIQTLTTSVDTLVSNLNIVVSDIQNKDKGIGKFLTDDEFFNNMNKTLSEIEKLTKNIRTKGIKLNIF